MRTGKSMRWRRWLLLLALAFALVGMHHVPAAPCGPHAVEQSESQPCHSSDGEHDLLHLCLMVLGFVAGTALTWLLLALTDAVAVLAGFVGAVGRWRPPRLAGRALLTSVCVSRT